MPRSPSSRTGVLATLVGLALLVSQAAAQDRAGPPWEQLVIKSRALGDRTILGETPRGYGRGRARYPVLVLLDADADALAGLADGYIAKGDRARAIVALENVRPPPRDEGLTALW